MDFLISLYKISALAEPALVVTQLEQLDYDNRIDGIEINADLENPIEVQRLFEYGHLLKTRNKRLQIHSPHGFNKLFNDTDKLTEYLSIYNALSHEINQPLSITIHPVESELKDISRYQTLKLITRLHSICQLKGYTLEFTLENLNLNRHRLDTEGIEPIIKQSSVGFCWDIGHEVYEDKCTYTLNHSLQTRLNNVHIHDIAESDHFPFRYGRTDYTLALAYLISISYTGSVVIEINTDYLLGENWTHKYMDYVSQVYLLADAHASMIQKKAQVI